MADCPMCNDTGRLLGPIERRGRVLQGMIPCPMHCAAEARWQASMAEALEALGEPDRIIRPEGGEEATRDVTP